MYKSPLELIFTDISSQIAKQIDMDCYQAVVQYVPNVDKDELIRALQYDRNQYYKGYADGKRDAMDELVRCKDCQYAKPYERVDGQTGYYCQHTKHTFQYGTNWERLYQPIKESSDFCSYGERREGE